MNGELWQECEICGDEPVCVNCFCCEKHCSCDDGVGIIDFKTFEMITRDDEHSYPHPAKKVKNW